MLCDVIEVLEPALMKQHTGQMTGNPQKEVGECFRRREAKAQDPQEGAELGEFDNRNKGSVGKPQWTAERGGV